MAYPFSKIFSISIIAALISLGLASRAQAAGMSEREIQDFFCHIEKFDDCFYKQNCSYRDYDRYTHYFEKKTNFFLQSINQFGVSRDRYYEGLNLMARVNNNFIEDENQFNKPQLARGATEFMHRYIDAKYNWLSWFSQNTHINYKNSHYIYFTGNQCGYRTYLKYLEKPLPEDADIFTCLIYYRLNRFGCSPDDKDLINAVYQLLHKS